jgi:hypothetical protein
MSPRVRIVAAAQRLWPQAARDSGAPGATPARAEGAGGAFDAFVSYSRAIDGRLAPALQSALQRFAKPWYRMRAKRIFRDDASLSANPGLWSSIEQALEASEFFILLASTDAAASRWVTREVSCWLQNASAERLLIVLTDGDLVWDEVRGAFGCAR